MGLKPPIKGGIESFRRIGHTQVNVTDLRLMKYPSRDMFISLGKWASKQGEPTQEEIRNYDVTLIRGLFCDLLECV